MFNKGRPKRGLCVLISFLFIAVLLQEAVWYSRNSGESCVHQEQLGVSSCLPCSGPSAEKQGREGKQGDTLHAEMNQGSIESTLRKLRPRNAAEPAQSHRQIRRLQNGQNQGSWLSHQFYAQGTEVCNAQDHLEQRLVTPSKKARCIAIFPTQCVSMIQPESLDPAPTATRSNKMAGWRGPLICHLSPPQVYTVYPGVGIRPGAMMHTSDCTEEEKSTYVSQSWRHTLDC